MASNIATKTARNPMGQAKQIASEFVRQYYTLLNKAPNHMHNFYNHDSAFIHGTIEMGSDRHTEPAFGREEIENKMKELKLNDCRAKIEQIDCLETFAGGLVIQVIGELSNNGRPMRRFLQTFVLAPWHKEQTARQDGDQLSASESGPGSGSQQNSSQVNQKPTFYVLNNIFRYQDDGLDSEFEDDNIIVHANTSTDNASAAAGQSGNNDEHESVDQLKQIPADTASKQQQQQQQQKPQQPLKQPQPPPISQQQQQQQHQQQASSAQVPYNQHQAATSAPSVDAPKLQQQSQPQMVDKPTLAKPQPIQQSNVEPIAQDFKRADNNTASVRNGLSQVNTNSTVKKSDVPEKSTENNRSSGGEQVKGPSATSESVSSGQSAPNNKGAPTTPSQPPAPRPNETKTWANIISRNAHPTPPQPVAAAVTSNMAKTAQNEQQHQHSQATPNQANQQIPHHHHHLQDHASHHQQQQQQSHQPQQQQMQQNQQTDHGQRGQGNARRRNMIRKTSNKPPAGRTMKDRPRPPPTGKPVA